MDEFLIEYSKKDMNSPLNSIDTSKSSNSLYYNSDSNVYDLLRFSGGKSSKCKRKLVRILARLYIHQILIIISSFIIGFIFLAIPLIFIFIKLLNNVCFPLFITCIFGLLFSIISIIIICVDSKRYKFLASAKWNRKSIIKNIGNLLLFICLTISVVFIVMFYHKIVLDQNKKIKFDYNEQSKSGNSLELSSDFIFKYILYILLLEKDKIEQIKHLKIKIIFDNWDLNNVRQNFMYICIPIVVIAFFALVKIFLIDVRQTIEKIIFFGGIFTLSIFQCFIDSTSIENLKEKNLNISSIYQNVIIIIILLGYIFWTINYTLLLIKKRKDKNFAIRKYQNINIIIIVILDIITCLGYIIITISIIYCYITFNIEEENFYYLYISFSILKIGFIPVIIGNSYYFGYYFLSMIFRPIAEEFSPCEFKNNFYIRSKRNLHNFMITKFRKKRKQEIIKKDLGEKDE